VWCTPSGSRKGYKPGSGKGGREWEGEGEEEEAVSRRI